MAKKQLKDKQKQLREFIKQTNANEGAEVLRRDSGREKVYKDIVPKSAESNRKPERYESLSPSHETKPDAPQDIQEDNEGNSSPEQSNTVRSSMEAVTAPDNVNNKSVDNGEKSGIIKSIDVDDYELVTHGKGIAPEVNDVIINTMKKCEKEGGFVISEISDKIVPLDTEGTPVLQIEPTANGLLKLNVNVEYLSGKSLEEINKAFFDTDKTVVNTLEEAVIHESGHAISIKGKLPNEVEKLYQKLKKLGKPGVSEIALNDGAECLAELEVLRYRKTKVSKELSDFYKKYMRRNYS